MHTIELNGEKLSTIIMSLEIEAFRIRQYHEVMLELRGTAMTEYDSERLEQIEALVRELKLEQRGG
ncbi:MAG: hypothetical protein AUG51_13020 [Acidobacteria bacterium 13_1_20CM_3_53_8]|nr:MAG: hypothetical protein AUG51_13020 [Acidobacteria bacterium 13_1_20CM_3_53_8]